MSDLELILKPFCGSEGPAWRRRLWTLLLLGGPVMFLLGFWMKEHAARGPGFRVELDRNSAIAMARALAKDEGLDTSGWREHVRFEQKPLAMRYSKTLEPGGGWRGRRFLPQATATVFLMRPDGRRWVRATLGVQGFPSEFRVGGELENRNREETTEEQAKAIAEKTLRQWLGGMAMRMLEDPEVSTAEDAGAAGARRFTWRMEPRNAPNLELVARVDVDGSRVVGREIEPVFSAEFLEQEVSHPAVRADAWGTLRLGLMVFLVLYAIYRYARRTVEKEAPHSRALILMGLFVLVSSLFTIGNPDASVNQLSAESVRTFFVVLRMVLSVLAAAIMGGLIGVAYGAGEGEVREGWPGKLTSLDAVLTGKVWTSNVGISVVCGLAWAGWLFGALSLAQAALGERVGSEAMQAVGFVFGHLPFLLILANAPLSAVTLTVLALLAPLTFLRRHAKQRWLTALLLVGVSFLLGGIADRIEPDSAVYWLQAAALCAAVLAPFYAHDYLASAVAVAGLNLVTKVSDISILVPHWRESAEWVGLAAVLAACPFAAAAWLARRVEEKDVRPAHAHNLAERLELQAELSAAKEAQERLLPEKPPEVPGLDIAASCIPAQAVRGDFYDFYTLSGGRLGLIVAEGGNEGLASALTIALAKGFLMWEAAEGTPLEKTVVRLQAALGAYLNRDGGRTSLGLFLVDPALGIVRMARTGAYPGLLVVRADGSVREPALREAAEPAGLETAEVALESGDALVAYTDGLPRLMQERSAGTPAELLKKAAWFGQAWTAETLRGALLDAVAGKSDGPLLNDDLTAVVVRCERRQARLEEVA